MPIKEGGNGLIFIEDWVRLAVLGLELCIHSSDERLTQAHKMHGLEATSILKIKRKERRLQNWEGECFTQTVL